MRDMIFGIAIAFIMWYGVEWFIDRGHSNECDQEMRTWFGGQEYVCMAVPSDGLPRNNEELMK